MKQKIQFAKDMIKCFAGIEFDVIEYRIDAFEDYLRKTVDGLLGELSYMIEHTSQHWHLQSSCIYELRTAIGLQYMFFLSVDKDHLFILGPSLMENYSEAAARQWLSHFPLSQKTVQKLLNRCGQLPLVSINQMFQTSILLIRHLTGSDAAVTHQVIDLMLDFNQPQQPQQQGEILRMRQVENRYELSNTLTEAVKQGNLSMAMSILNGYNPGLDNDTRNTNPLRNFQNYCIVLNTQLRHALEKSGIHPYRLDRLSNEIGLEIENMRSMVNYKDFIFSALQRYCKLVQTNSYPDLNPLIHLAVTYIKDHLNEDLTVKETAKLLGVNANYLSTQFHNSTGMTFIDFVHKERSAQAAALLKQTNLQIQQIASVIGYNNTSYFAKQFLRYYGMSPSDYRSGGTL